MFVDGVRRNEFLILNETPTIGETSQNNIIGQNH